MIVSSNHVRYPSLSRYYSYLSLVYDLRQGYTGVYSHIFNGSNWSEASSLGTKTGTVYNRTASITIDIEGNPLCAWRGQIYDGGVDPYYSIVFRKGYHDNTWSDWFVIFNHNPDPVTYYSPSITAMSRDQMPAGIGIIHSTTNNYIHLRKYSYEKQEWTNQIVSATGNRPNIAEYFPNTTDHVRYMWTNQSNSPYLIEVDWDYSEDFSSIKRLVSNKKMPNQRKITNLTHKRRAVIRDKKGGSYMVIDIDPLIIQNTNLEKRVLPFKAHNFLDSIDVTFYNMKNYLCSETDSLKNEAKFLKHNFKISISGGVDSSGNKYTNIFDGKYQVFLNVKDVRNPKSNVRVNVTNTASFILDITNFRGKEIEVQTEIEFTNLDTTVLDIGIGDVYSPVTSVSQQNLAVSQVEKLKLSRATPDKYFLNQNYPNPFNPETAMLFGLPADVNVSVKIYSIIGEEITTLVDAYMQRGYHELKWDGRNRAGIQVASGIYFSVLRSGDQMLVRKMMLMR